MNGNVRERLSTLPVTYALSLLALLFLPFSLSAATDSACITCHEGKTFAVSKDGSKKAVAFSRTDLSESVHRGVRCTECHNDAMSLPHQKPLSPVDCARCHQRGGTAVRKKRSWRGGEAGRQGCAILHIMPWGGTSDLWRIRSSIGHVQGKPRPGMRQVSHGRRSAEEPQAAFLRRH